MLIKCSVCNNEMDIIQTSNGLKYFCKQCNEFTEAVVYEEVFSCDKCDSPIDVIASCGGDSFYCSKCQLHKNKSDLVVKHTEIK